jgi:hypothetical protein
MRFQIITINKHDKEFHRSIVLDSDEITITQALRKYVNDEVFFAGDTIRIVELKPS